MRKEGQFDAPGSTPSLVALRGFGRGDARLRRPRRRRRRVAGLGQASDQPVANRNLKAAEIELRNAIQQSPQDPLLRIQLARALPAARRSGFGRARGARRARLATARKPITCRCCSTPCCDRASLPTSPIWSNPAIAPPRSKAKCDWRSASPPRGFTIAPRPRRCCSDAIRLDPSRAAAQDHLGADAGGDKPRRSKQAARPGARRRSALDRSAPGQGGIGAGSGRHESGDEPASTRPSRSTPKTSRCV